MGKDKKKKKIKKKNHINSVGGSHIAVHVCIELFNLIYIHIFFVRNVTAPYTAHLSLILKTLTELIWSRCRVGSNLISLPTNNKSWNHFFLKCSKRSHSKAKTLIFIIMGKLYLRTQFWTEKSTLNMDYVSLIRSVLYLIFPFKCISLSALPRLNNWDFLFGH